MNYLSLLYVKYNYFEKVNFDFFFFFFLCCKNKHILCLFGGKGRGRKNRGWGGGDFGGAKDFPPSPTFLFFSKSGRKLEGKRVGLFFTSIDRGFFAID
jgi:hypothetical protein